MNWTVLDLPWWHWALAACFVVCAVGGVYVVLRVRKEWKEPPASASDLMANFRDLRAEGDLTEQEFRTIKTLLADKLQQELNDNGKGA